MILFNCEQNFSLRKKKLAHKEKIKCQAENIYTKILSVMKNKKAKIQQSKAWCHAIKIHQQSSQLKGKNRST